jgi:hypothetical protein
MALLSLNAVKQRMLTGARDFVYYTFVLEKARTTRRRDMAKGTTFFPIE